MLPLCWLDCGSVAELLELPVSMLNRLLRIVEEDGVMDRFWYYHDGLHLHKGKR